MGEVLGQQVVVENVGGAGGTTGGLRVADAAPDGYNVILASVGTHAQNQTLYKRPPYNAAEDFTPVAFLGETPIALITRKDLPVKDFNGIHRVPEGECRQDEIWLGRLRLATHLGCVVLNTAMGTNITHVPYRGTGPGDAGSAGRTHRLPVRDHHHRKAPDRGRRHQGACDHDQGSLARAAKPSTTGEQGLTCRLIRGARCAAEGRAGRGGEEAE